VRPEPAARHGLCTTRSLIGQASSPSATSCARSMRASPSTAIEGLALWRDGQVLKLPSAPRSRAGTRSSDAAWHLLDIDPYRAHQMRTRAATSTSCA
jgi:hypothetical protein